MKNIDLLAYREPLRLVHPAPWVGHIPFAFWIVKVSAPNVLVELGTHTGNSYLAFCQAVVESGLQTKAFAVDTWQGDVHAGIYSEDVYSNLHAYHQPLYAAFSTLMRMTFDDALAKFEDHSVDLLHIDGLHTYEAVRHDFETWRRKLSDRGVILFHDTHVYERGFGVHTLWAELKQQYPFIDFSHSNGLGVLLLGNNQPPELVSMAQSPSPELERVPFETLGRNLERSLALSELKRTFDERVAELKERGDYIETMHRKINADASEAKDSRAAWQAELAAHRNAFHELSLQLEHANSSLREQRDDLNKVTCRLHEVSGALHETRRSTSWKVTRPLRAFGRILRYGRTLARFGKRFIAPPSALYALLLVGRREWRLSGLRGLKRWIFNTAQGGGVIAEIGASPVGLSAHLKKRFGNDSSSWAKRPLISILMPTYNTGQKVLTENLESVLAQIYPNWELCVVDDASPNTGVRTLLEQYAARDSRIKPIFLEKNVGVSVATNRALATATGEYVVFLDHDDALEPQAIFRVAETAVHDAPDFLYSDEVIVGADGVSVLGYAMRPAFSPEYLRNHPYIVHLIGFRTEFARQLGGLDGTLKISQDYDFILRASERAKKIVHIPEVLYRWRTQRNSAGHQLKKTVMETSRAAIERQLERVGDIGHVEDGPSFNFFSPRYTVNADVRVAIIIPTKNWGNLVRQCVESIERTVQGLAYEIVLVDHDSTDEESLHYFAELALRHTVIRYSGAFNFSVINNCAVAQLDDRFSHYLFCNNDIEAIIPGWLNRMVELGQKPDIGIVGAKLLYPGGRQCQHAGVGVGMFGAAEHYGKFLDVGTDESPNTGYMGGFVANREMSAVTAACMLMRRDAFERIGGYDESLAVGFGDVDICLRARKAGFRVLFCAQAVLVHHESISRGKSTTDPHPEDSTLFCERWGDFIREGDPYFSPNLSPTSTRWDVCEPLSVSPDIRRRVFVQAGE